MKTIHHNGHTIHHNGHTIHHNGHTIHHNETTNTFTVLLMKSPGVVEKTMQARSLRAAQIMITKYNSEV
jgi:hypothetical protein